MLHLAGVHGVPWGRAASQAHTLLWLVHPAINYHGIVPGFSPGTGSG